ncbi:MAG: fibronectin type III domain-containing protein [Cyclobacteriaceae bacterium]|nr:fibronectin type III domain-containing protein [Cyclobacteriaceae bacterium]
MKKWFFISLLLFQCQNDEADAPELITEDAQQIGTTSVVMGAEVKKIGPVRPVNYGFLWDTQPDISIATAGNKVILGSLSGPRKFSIRLDNLKPATTYYYRGFAANEGYSIIYYAGTVQFTTLP